MVTRGCAASRQPHRAGTACSGIALQRVRRARPHQHPVTPGLHQPPTANPGHHETRPHTRRHPTSGLSGADPQAGEWSHVDVPPLDNPTRPGRRVRGSPCSRRAGPPTNPPQPGNTKPPPPRHSRGHPPATHPTAGEPNPQAWVEAGPRSTLRVDRPGATAPGPGPPPPTTTQHNNPTQPLPRATPSHPRTTAANPGSPRGAWVFLRAARGRGCGGCGSGARRACICVMYIYISEGCWGGAVRGC